MKRDPSIHITQSRLREILSEATSVHISELYLDDLVNEIMNEAKKYPAVNRTLLVSNQKLERKATMLTKSSMGDAQLFARLLTMIRRSLKHRGINIIKETSKDWGMIKECASLAVDFCNDFNLDKEEGFKQYIQIALGKMNKFSLMKLNSMHQGICEFYGAKQDLQNDDYPSETREAHDVYCNMLLDTVGISSDYYKDQPDKCAFFILAAEEARKLKISPKVYIQAQFAGLQYRNGVPDPAQLIGVKAIERVKAYMYENSLSIKQANTQNVDFKYLRNLKRK